MSLERLFGQRPASLGPALAIELGVTPFDEVRRITADLTLEMLSAPSVLTIPSFGTSVTTDLATVRAIHAALAQTQVAFELCHEPEINYVTVMFGKL